VIGPGVAAEERERWTRRRLASRFNGSRNLDACLELRHAQAVLLGPGNGLLEREAQRTFLRQRRRREQGRERERDVKMPGDVHGLPSAFTGGLRPPDPLTRFRLR
jgi:hypothetical protein